jgi:hypothetical protein
MLTQDFTQCDYVQIMNIASGALLSQNWEEGDCMSIQLLNEDTPNSRFLISQDESLGTSFWTVQNPNTMLAVEGQDVKCTKETTGSLQYNLIANADSQSYLIEVLGDPEKPSRYLSTQYGEEVKALISLETSDDMIMLANETGDYTAMWQLICHTEVQATI